MSLYVEIKINQTPIHRVVARNTGDKVRGKTAYKVSWYKKKYGCVWELQNTIGTIWHNRDDGAIVLSGKILKLYDKFNRKN